MTQAGRKMVPVVRSVLAIAVAVVLSVPAVPTPVRAASGPTTGAVLAIGGGDLVPEIARRFVALAGGPQANFVLIPTAEEDRNISDLSPRRYMRVLGVERLVMLHTRDRRVADSEAFVAPLRAASGVFFGGGRQWRVTDAYLNTRTHAELRAVLARGGVIAGTSAGASLLASYMVRGAPEGNTIMMAPGHEEGFGFIDGIAIDQHVTARRRERDLMPVVASHPGLLGIGIDQCTAIVVQGEAFEVIGQGRVYVTDSRTNNGTPFLLSSGDHFNLATREKTGAVHPPAGNALDPCVTKQ